MWSCVLLIESQVICIGRLISGGSVHRYLGVDMPTKARVNTAIAAKRAREADARGSLGDAAAEPVVKAVRKPFSCACCGRSAVSSYSIASGGDTVNLRRECCGDIYAEYMSHKGARRTCEISSPTAATRESNSSKPRP